MTNQLQIQQVDEHDIKSCVIEILKQHKGAENKISRNDLLLNLQLTLNSKIHDRDMRKAIETLRATHQLGSLICSSTSGGYWLAVDLQELDEYLRQDEARIREMAKRIRRQRVNAGLLVNQQLSLFANDERN